MGSSGSAFKASLGSWAKKAGANLQGLARVSIQDLCEAVTDETNIDTGFLVSSWQPSIEPPNITEMIDKPKDFVSASAGEAAARTALVIPQLKLGMTYYYTNNVKYGPFVEYGTSKFEGFFFVTRNVAKWKTFVNGAAVKLGMTK